MGFLNNDILSQFWLPSKAWFRICFCLIRLLPLTFSLDFSRLYVSREYVILIPSLPLLCNCPGWASLNSGWLQSHHPSLVLPNPWLWGSPLWALTPLTTKWRSEIPWANSSGDTPLRKSQYLCSAHRSAGQTEVEGEVAQDMEVMHTHYGAGA